jgi:phosphate transport system protein
MPRDQFQRLLDDLREDVLAYGETVVERLRVAVAAVETDDDEAAESVLQGEPALNERYLELEGRCIDIFALQQPVAGDLRFVAASFKILTDLERVADLAVNLAAYVRTTDETLFPSVSFGDVGEMAAEMLADALSVYADPSPDSEGCFRVAERDDELDGLCEAVAAQIIAELVEMDAAPADMESLLTDVNRLLLTVRDVERVGDHAVNVAARTLYLAESDDTLLY